ncbi:uncharacterized protein LOC118648347 [Monomorium pharaonis]|uniref:uncharacterized protein LOC118648347 n=1 Tax=Monomorium pharaonis TaxID=307658 RepID=UPI001745E641|nr:uncharacterized protein LOC118648347 [Monomorium pharaonis]
MAPVCAKCKKSVATASVECDCKRVFHPGCVKAYSLAKYADACCKSLTSSLCLPPTPSEDIFARPIDSDTASSVTPGCAGALLQSQSREDINADTATNRLLRQLIDQLKQSEARFSAFAEEQRRTNSVLNDKLNYLNSLACSVERNGQRIDALEQQCAALESAVRDFKGDCKLSLPASCSPTEDALILSGVPAAMSISPSECARNIFTALGIPDLSCHILKVRSVTRRNQSGAVRDPPGPISSTKSLIITVASSAVRDLVIAKKRERGTLTQREICCNDSSRSVHVNELLPRDTYELLQKTKQVAKANSYTYVWVKNGRIHVRHSDGKPIIYINSESDLGGLI